MIISCATLIVQPDLPYGSLCTRSLYCDNFGDSQRQPNPVRELNIGAFAERSDGLFCCHMRSLIVLLRHGPVVLGPYIAGQIGHLLASCGPEDFDSHPCLHPRFCLGEWDRGVWLLCCLWPL